MKDKRTGNEGVYPAVGTWADRLAPILLLCAVLLTTVGFVLSFTWAPPVYGASVNGVEVIGGQVVSNVLLISQKIFYFHMPVAITSFLALVAAAVYALRFLMTRQSRFDTMSRVCMEIALVFIIMTMATGVMWTRFEWGVWWTWEPRLTTYFILMLIVIGYFILRNAIDDPERRATFAGVLAIIAFVDAPICFMITRLVPSSIHPVVLRQGGGMGVSMIVPLLMIMFGMLMLGFVLYRLRLRSLVIEQKCDAIMETLEDQRESA